MKHSTGITIKEFGEIQKALSMAARDLSVTYEEVKPTKKRKRIKKRDKVGSSVTYIESMKLKLNLNDTKQ